MLVLTYLFFKADVRHFVSSFCPDCLTKLAPCCLRFAVSTNTANSKSFFSHVDLSHRSSRLNCTTTATTATAVTTITTPVLVKVALRCAPSTVKLSNDEIDVVFLWCRTRALPLPKQLPSGLESSITGVTLTFPGAVLVASEASTSNP